MAVRWVSLQGPGRALLRAPGRRPQLVELPADEDEVSKRTTLCLTTPYDKALVACVETLGAIGECYRAFEARHGPVFVPPE